MVPCDGIIQLLRVQTRSRISALSSPIFDRVPVRLEDFVLRSIFFELRRETGEVEQSVQIVAIHFLDAISLRRKLESLSLLRYTGLKCAFEGITCKIIRSQRSLASKQDARFFDAQLRQGPEVSAEDRNIRHTADSNLIT